MFHTIATNCSGTIFAISKYQTWPSERSLIFYLCPLFYGYKTGVWSHNSKLFAELNDMLLSFLFNKLKEKTQFISKIEFQILIYLTRTLVKFQILLLQTKLFWCFTNMQDDFNRENWGSWIILTCVIYFNVYKM